MRQAIDECQCHEPPPVGFQLTKAGAQGRGVAEGGEPLEWIGSLVDRFREIVAEHFATATTRNIQRAITHETQQPSFGVAPRLVEAAGVAPDLQQCIMHRVRRQRPLAGDPQRHRVKPRRLQLIHPPEGGAIARRHEPEQDREVRSAGSLFHVSRHARTGVRVVDLPRKTPVPKQPRPPLTISHAEAKTAHLCYGDETGSDAERMIGIVIHVPGAHRTKCKAAVIVLRERVYMKPRGATGGPMRSIRWWRWLALSAACLPALGGVATSRSARAEDALTNQERVVLQSAMAQYIDQHMIGDAFIHLDPKTGDVQRLYPVSQHTMIVRLHEVIVLCADLRTQDGTLVNADFYATKADGQFVVFQSEIGNREPLKALIVKGAASLLE
jgi:hypothetical protein